jgi:ABC-type cobalamin transport system permease subunit
VLTWYRGKGTVHLAMMLIEYYISTQIEMEHLDYWMVTGSVFWLVHCVVRHAVSKPVLYISLDLKI